MTLRVRAARPGDYDAFVGFWRELGIEQAPPPYERWEGQLCPSTIFLEAEGGALAAYGLSFAFGARGDVRQIVVAPAFRGRGVGHAIMAAVRDRLRAAGCSEWRLEVKMTNAPALALYRAVGMEPLHEIAVLRMSGDLVERFAATRSGRHAVIVQAPEDDAELEANLDLGPGQIARWRASRAHCPILRAGTRALVQIWRDFSPERGLLWPFRAPDADVAAHLVAAAAPLRDYELELRDRAVIDALVAAGATRHDRLFEMGGAI